MFNCLNSLIDLPPHPIPGKKKKKKKKKPGAQHEMDKAHVSSVLGVTNLTRVKKNKIGQQVIQVLLLQLAHVITLSINIKYK